jgi:hypothetical protein
MGKGKLARTFSHLSDVRADGKVDVFIETCIPEGGQMDGVLEITVTNEDDETVFMLKLQADRINLEYYNERATLNDGEGDDV